MKSVRHAVLAGCAAIAIVGGAFAATNGPAPDPNAPPAGNWHGPGPGQHRGGPGHMGGLPFMGALRKLNLTPEQQQSIHAILDSAKSQHQAQRQQNKANIEAIASTLPDSPNYPAVVQQEKQLAANAIQQRSDLAVQVYAVLTAEQKAQLPTIIADAKAKMEARRQNWQGKRPAPPAAG